MTDFFRYPHTPHLWWLTDGYPRDDKVLSAEQANYLLLGAVVIEEKLDGANMGISIGTDGNIRVQNRGQYLSRPFVGQFSRLEKWLEVHQDRLFDGLNESLIFFGEWCAARHSLDYDQLPDWWLMFDVYDRDANRFWSSSRRNELALKYGFQVVPCLYQGSADLCKQQVLDLSATSCFRSGVSEGVVIRQEDAMWLQARAKLVRPNFMQAISTHWRSRILESNRLRR
jgi:ATP-dependent RNA circularization protein (DNA/RNA ligase family)